MHRWQHLDGPGARPQAQPPTSLDASEDTSAQPRTNSALGRLPEVLKVKEAAAILRVGRNQLYEAVARGELPAVRIGRTIRIPTAALLDLLAAHPGQPATAAPPHRRSSQEER